MMRMLDDSSIVHDLRFLEALSGRSGFTYLPPTSFPPRPMPFARQRTLLERNPNQFKFDPRGKPRFGMPSLERCVLPSATQKTGGTVDCQIKNRISSGGIHDNSRSASLHQARTSLPRGNFSSLAALHQTKGLSSLAIRPS